MKNWIVYHQVKSAADEGGPVDCPDGICAAWIVSRAIPGFNPLDSWELVGDSYKNTADYEGVKSLPFEPYYGDRIWLVDFSYPATILEALVSFNQLVILDHHATRLDDISQVSDRILGGYYSKECGATAAWKLCYPLQPMPWFLKHVWRRDTGADGFYDGDTLDSRAITAAISARRKGRIGVEVFPVFEQLLFDSYYEVFEEGQALLAMDDERCIQIIWEWEQSPVFENFGGVVVPKLVLAKEDVRLLSWVGALLARAHAPESFVAIQVKGSQAISLRSISTGMNVGEIAAGLGGGGHRNAAGFTARKDV